MRCLRALAATAVVLACLLPVGCGPKIAKKDLGDAVFEIPNVPGSEHPYPLPALETPNPHQEHRPRNRCYLHC